MSAAAEEGAISTEGAVSDGAGQPAAEPEEKSINSQAKNLPWVQDLMRVKAEFDRLTAEQAEAKQNAEREKAESEGRYQDALKMEQEKTAELEARYRAETKALSLKSELVTQGFRPQALKLFIDDYNPDESSAADFASKLRANEENAWLLVDTQHRTPHNPPPASGLGKGQTVDPSWITSDDPKKRLAAIELNRRGIFGKRSGA